MRLGDGGFTTQQAATFSGVAADSIDYWTRSGFIVPSVSAGAGRGTERRWSFADVRALRVAKELRDLGFPLQRLRKVVAFLQGFDETLASAQLVVAGEDIRLARDGTELISLLQQPGQYALRTVVDLGAIETHLREAIAA